MNNNSLTIGIAQGNVVCCPEQLISYALGSCVGICLYDRKRKIAGMAHIMLPHPGIPQELINPYKFADSGCEELLRRMRTLGCVQSYVTAKIAGGASMFHTSEEVEGIGARNVKAVKEVLGQLHIPVIAEDTGKDYGRTIIFDSATGALTVKSFKTGTIVI